MYNRYKVNIETKFKTIIPFLTMLTWLCCDIRDHFVEKDKELLKLIHEILTKHIPEKVITDDAIKE